MSEIEKDNALLDRLAGLAMHALIAQGAGMYMHPDKISELAYRHANSMLTEREKHISWDAK